MKDKDLYTGYLLSTQLYSLLKTISSGYAILIDEKLNNLYLELCNRLEKTKMLDLTRPYEDLFSVGEDIDIEWDNGGRQNFTVYLTRLKGQIKDTKQKYSLSDLSKSDFDLLKKAYAVNSSYKKYKTEVNENSQEDLDKLTAPNPLAWEEKCGFRNGTFWVQLANNTPAGISFKIDNKNDMYEALRYMFNKWTTSSKDGVVFIRKTELLDHIRKMNDRGYEEKNLRSTISNLRKVIIGSKLKDIVSIDPFNVREKAFPFRINLP